MDGLTYAIRSVVGQIATLSQPRELFPGDIICSGAATKVGPVVPGDVTVCVSMGCTRRRGILRRVAEIVEAYRRLHGIE